MDHLEAINNDLNDAGYERAGLHRWVLQNGHGQLQVQAGAELREGRMVVFTGRFSREDAEYTTGGAWNSDSGEYVALLEARNGNGEPETFKQEGVATRVSDVIRSLERRAQAAQLA